MKRILSLTLYGLIAGITANMTGCGDDDSSGKSTGGNAGASGKGGGGAATTGGKNSAGGKSSGGNGGAATAGGGATGESGAGPQAGAGPEVSAGSGGAAGTGPAAETGGTAGAPGASGGAETAGGTASAGTPGEAGMTGAAGAPNTPGFTSDGGYVNAGDWHGAAFTYSNTSSAVGAHASSIDPLTFAALSAGQPLCATGTVGAASDFNGNAAIGINLNQASTPGATPMSISPTGSGITLNVTNTGHVKLQIQLVASDATWCSQTTLTGNISIDYANFTTTCYSSTDVGATYDNQAIESIHVMIPGGNTTDVVFDLCVNDLVENP